MVERSRQWERDHAEPPMDIETMFVKEGGAPVVVVYKKQVEAIFKGPAMAIAKPWQTPYRGEAFVYIPEKSRYIPIEPPEIAYPYPILERGIIGIAEIACIDLVASEAGWESTFEDHLELGLKPFPTTYLWYLRPISIFTRAIPISVAGKWLENVDDSGDGEFHQMMLNPGPYRLKPLERTLHSISLRSFIYRG